MRMMTVMLSNIQCAVSVVPIYPTKLIRECLADNKPNINPSSAADAPWCNRYCQGGGGL